MKRLLARENRDLLAQLACSPALLAFDFDGTLAPIVAERDRAAMRPETAVLFRKVCGVFPVAVISGRAKGDVRARLANADVKYVVGNHGLEPGANMEAFEAEMREVASRFAESFGSMQGVDIEDKRYSLAVHYRRARKKGAVRQAIERAASALPRPVRLVPGKLVVNVVPARAPNKGDALLDLRSRENASIALYVGDDTTDEDVFRIDQPGRILGARVGESRGSLARYFLRDQREMDTLLRWLYERRRERAHG